MLLTYKMVSSILYPVHHRKARLSGWSALPMERKLTMLYATTCRGQYAPNIQDGFINVVPSTPLEGKTIRLECFAYGT